MYGDMVYVTAPAGGMVGGQAYVFGAMIGISAVTEPAGTPLCALWVVGIFRMPKAAGLVTTMGEKLYYNAATNTVTATNTDAPLGVATSIQAAGDATVDVRLGGAF
jgi:predicted RecA/RadA family phage recombinase